MASLKPPANSSHIVMRGTAPGGEVWSTGWWESLSETSGDAADQLSTLMAVGGWSAFVTAVKNLMTQQGSFTTLEAYQYDASRALKDKASVAISGGLGTRTVPTPNTVALVMTLRTANLLRSGRGRMYFPGFGLTVLTNGLYDAERPDALRVALANVLSVRPAVVASPTRNALYPITAVDNDYIPDTIRARSDALVSARPSTPVT